MQKEASVQTMKTASNLAKYATIGLGFLGVGFIYMYIYLLEIADTDKVLYAGILTIALAFLCLGVYSMLQDSIKAAERTRRRKRFK